MTGIKLFGFRHCARLPQVFFRHCERKRGMSAGVKQSQIFLFSFYYVVRDCFVTQPICAVDKVLLVFLVMTWIIFISDYPFSF